MRQWTEGMRMLGYGLWLAIVASVCAGCGSPSSPSTFFGLGATMTPYTGRAEDSVLGTGTATMTLATVQGVTSGTVDLTFAGKSEPRRIISGLITNGVYTARFSQCADQDTGSSCSGPCQFTFAGSVTSTSVAGSYAAVVTQTCSARSGTMTLAH